MHLFNHFNVQSEDICSVQCGSHQEKPEIDSFSAITGELLLMSSKQGSSKWGGGRRGERPGS